jgi:hypothetical protein
MTPTSEFRRTIDDPNAPARLKGLLVTATLVEGDKGSLTFKIDMPDDPTPNEIGYFRWFIGETVDKLKAASPIEFSDPREYQE